MAELSKAREGEVRRLIEQVPDGAIRSLETALNGRGRGDESLALVHTMVSAEMVERRTRAAVFAPLAPLFSLPADGMRRLSFPPDTAVLAWRGLKLAAASEVAQAQRAYATLRADADTPPVFDALCRQAADGLRAGAETFAPLSGRLAAWDGGTASGLAQALALAPLARLAVRRLPAWTRTQSNEYAAAVRLAFRDAVAVSEDAGPAFMEILFGHLEEPSQVLRLVSVVMDRPSDRYVAASELATFGVRLLDDLDRRIADVRRFDTARGLEGGVSLGLSVQRAAALIQEFEQWISLGKEGPWGARLAGQKRMLAYAVESRLREIEGVVGQALSAQPARAGVRARRGAPRLTADPDAAAVTRAMALLGFLNEIRPAAAHAGFGAVRARVVEALGPRIDQYAEDLIDLLHAGEGEPQRVRAYLDVTAEFLGLVRDPKAAEIVRRRTAVA